jgi:hypothetical protein
MARSGHFATTVCCRLSGKKRHNDLTLPCLLMTQSVGLPPPFQSERFCSVTVIDWAYIT